MQPPQEQYAYGQQPTNQFAQPPAAAATNPRKTQAIITWVAIGALLLVTVLSAVGSLQRTFYGPQGLVMQYLDALASKNAAGALALPGVKLDKAKLKDAGLPAGSTAALLRSEVLPELTGITFVSDEDMGNGVHDVTFDYTSGSTEGSSTFSVVSDGPFNWRFDVSPISVINLTVKHSTQFSVNGFAVDTRQLVSKDTKPKFTNILNIQAFTGVDYTFKIKNKMLTSDSASVLASDSSQVAEAEVEAKPTDAFNKAAQSAVNAKLKDCAKQKVLQPTGCPFGVHVTDRISGDPKWSITEFPEIELEAGENSWEIPDVDGEAKIKVDVQSIFDGSIDHEEEDVSFTMFGEIYLFADGTVTAVLLSDADTEDEE